MWYADTPPTIAHYEITPDGDLNRIDARGASRPVPDAKKAEVRQQYTDRGEGSGRHRRSEPDSGGAARNVDSDGVDARDDEAGSNELEPGLTRTPPKVPNYKDKGKKFKCATCDGTGRSVDLGEVEPGVFDPDQFQDIQCEDCDGAGGWDTPAPKVTVKRKTPEEVAAINKRRLERELADRAKRAAQPA